MSRILVTGISGFVGKHTIRELLKDETHVITGLIRPNTDKTRISEFSEQVEMVEIDLCDINSLKKWINTQQFDIVLHIGALRGGRPDDKDKYYLANVEATIILANYCLEQNARLIFCSSVGVFGAIPKHLPADDSTVRQDDNYYHFTKIRCEAIIEQLEKDGLKSVIVRPAITYGEGDHGFPFGLCKLVDKKMMLLPKDKVKIHLTDVTTLAKAFVYLVNNAGFDGNRYIVADQNPVDLHELVNFISNDLTGHDYCSKKIVSTSLFRIGEKISRILKNELFVSRFELISRNWYYNVTKTYNDLPLEAEDSLPKFRKVIEWYKDVK